MMKCNLSPRTASFKEAEVGTHKVQGPVNDNIKVNFPKLQCSCFLCYTTTRHVWAEKHNPQTCREYTRMQSTFKIDLVIRDNGANDQPPKKKPRPFATRKTHQKSRNGCAACKKRRIKVGVTYVAFDGQRSRG